MQQVERFERPHHHLEMRDPAVVADGDHVDAIDPDAVDLAIELDDRAGFAPPLAEKGKTRPAQHLHRTGQI